MKFNKLNNIVGWGVFAIALTVYLLTMERSVSFWDCGEFIAAANKLQVVHPPGAPLYLMLGRLFSMFLPPHMVAWGVNFLSVASTAFASMFIFWSVSILARRIIGVAKENLDKGQTLAILGSGAVAAFAFVFQDTQWFNGVEAEAYSVSVLLTSMVIWMALKWSEHSEDKGADRWLLGIAYIIGLSIGVHLLNLLTIPAIALLFYYKRYKNHNWKGALLSIGIGSAILLFVQIGIIQIIPKIGSVIELAAVNKFGLPFGSGLLFLFVLLAALIVFALITSHKRKAYALQLSSLSFAFILIGFMSYALVLIRSNSNPPIDINNPDNVFNLMSYLNREQYGSRPLVLGPMYDAEVTGTKKTGDVYVKTEDGYKDVDDDIEYTYDQAKVLFPRAWQFYDDRRVDFYKTWNGGVKPTTAGNISWMYTYQLDHMYWRYFMWNFAGRQNDNQNNSGGIENGNWISGFPWVDTQDRVSTSTEQPDILTQNKAKNKYFLIPFVLGLLSLVLHFKYNWRDASVLTTLFLLTGVAIVFYLNQEPLQPRERDYAYAGSFLVFAMWIGLAVASLFKASKKENWNYLASNALWFAGSIIALIVMGFQANHFSSNFGILITATAMATLILAIALLLKNVDGKAKALALTGLVGLAPILMAVQGWDDHDRSNQSLAYANGLNYLTSCKEDAILITEGDNDTYPLWYMQEVENVRPDIRILNNSLLKGDWYIDQIKQHNGFQDGLAISFDQDKYVGSRRQMAYLNEVVDTVSLDQFIEFIKTDDKRAKLPTRDGDFVDAYPSRTVALEIDLQAQVANGLLTPAQAANADSVMLFRIPGESIIRDEIMMLDIINEYINTRPIYFTGANLPYNLGLSRYITQEGSSFRLSPIPDPTFGSEAYHYMDPYIDPDLTYTLLKDSLDFGNIGSGAHLTQTGRSQVYRLMDYTSATMIGLANKGEKEKALEVYNIIEDEIFNSSVARDDSYMLVKQANLVDALYKIGEKEKAENMSRIAANGAMRQLYFISDTYRVEEGDVIDNNMRVVLSNVIRYALRNDNKAMADEIQAMFDNYEGQ